MKSNLFLLTCAQGKHRENVSECKVSTKYRSFTAVRYITKIGKGKGEHKTIKSDDRKAFTRAFTSHFTANQKCVCTILNVSNKKIHL